MNFQTYARGILYGLENYMEWHTTQGTDAIKSWNEWGWIEDVYAPIYQAYTDIMEARTVTQFILEIEWASHLNHASGSIIRDYCSCDGLEETLDHLEQQGLEGTFPKWEKQARKTMRRLKQTHFPSPETLQEWIAAKCVYCGSDDLPVDKHYEPLSLACFKCQELLDQYGGCIHCEHGIGLFGELCLDCTLETTEVLL